MLMSGWCIIGKVCCFRVFSMSAATLPVMCSFEAYTLNETARQFGLCQLVHFPYLHFTVDEPAGSIFKTCDATIVRGALLNYQESMNAFQDKHFSANPCVSPNFLIWWEMIS